MYIMERIYMSLLRLNKKIICLRYRNGSKRKARTNSGSFLLLERGLGYNMVVWL